ncbi:MAG: lipocalin family protein [Oscillospiraceae bacterium]|nr:lipocalin family protein [Oscillospiraceae bacterium]
MMKRIISLTLVVLMIAAMFVGCGSSSLEGTYKIKSINGKDVMSFFREQIAESGEEDTEITDADVESFLKMMGIENVDEFVTITFASDGTLKASAIGEEETGTWTLDGEKLTMTIDGDDQTATFKNGEITVDMEGMNMVLGK